MMKYDNCKWSYFYLIDENEKCEMKCQTAIRPQPRSSMKSTTEITYESGNMLWKATCDNVKRI